MKLELSFGAMVPKLSEQLSSAGARADANAVLHWQRDLDAVTRLSVRGLLSPQNTARARLKIAKQIIKAVTPNTDFSRGAAAPSAGNEG